MIDVRDLMVGNWVYDSVLEKPIVLNNLPYGIDLSNREGIEVTEAMLIKLGFVKQDEFKVCEFWRYWDKEYRYKLDVDSGFCNSGRKWHLHIDNGDCNTIGSGEFTYLHELQSLVRVITGYNLPITKEMLYE